VNINLHIERLVLDGVSVERHQQAELKAAVETELGRLLMSNGIGPGVQSSNRFRVVSGDLISIDNTHKPASLGQQIGNVVYRGIGK